MAREESVTTKELGIAVIGSGRIGTLRARLAAKHPAVRFVVVLSLFSSVSGLLDLARYEFGKIVEGLLNLGCRDVVVQRGLKAFIRQGLGRRFVALGGKRLHRLDFPGNPGLDEFEGACTHV